MDIRNVNYGPYYEEHCNKKETKALLRIALVSLGVGIIVTALTGYIWYNATMHSLRDVDKQAIINEVLETYSPDGTLKQ